MVLLDKKQKHKMVLLVFLMLIGAVLETLGVSMILPVMSVVMEENAVQKHAYLQVICDLFHIAYDDTRTLMILVMVGLIVIFAVKNVFLFFQQKVQLKFVYTNQFATSRRMMINFMERPYEYYLNADTSVIQRSITSDVNNMYGLILSLLQLVSEGIVFVCLIAVSLVSDVMMSITVALLLVVVLAIIKWVLKPIMRKAGEENQDYYSGLYKWIDQSVMGIKEIKIANKENYFINEYAKCGEGYVNAVQCNSKTPDRNRSAGRHDLLYDDPASFRCTGYRHSATAYAARTGGHASDPLCQQDQQSPHLDFLFRTVLYGSF